MANGAVEAARLVALESAAFAQKAGQSGATGTGGSVQHQELIPHLKNFLVVNTVRQDPQVKAAVARVLARRAGGEQEVDVLGEGVATEGVSGAVKKDEVPCSKQAEMASAPAATKARSAEIGDIATSTSELADSSLGLEEDGPSTNATTASEDAPGDQPKPSKAPIASTSTSRAPAHKHAKNHKPLSRNTSPNVDTTPNEHDSALNNEDATPPATEPETPPEPDAGELADTEGETPLNGPPVLPVGAPPHGYHKKHSHSHAHGHGHGASGISQSVDMLSASEVREAREAEKARGYEGDVEGAGTGADGDSEA